MAASASFFFFWVATPTSTRVLPSGLLLTTWHLFVPVLFATQYSVAAKAGRLQSESDTKAMMARRTIVIPPQAVAPIQSLARQSMAGSTLLGLGWNLTDRKGSCAEGMV